MRGVFAGCSGLREINVQNWNTSKVTDLAAIFSSCSIKTVDVSNWDTSQVTDMQLMFMECYQLESIDISNFNTEKVTSMRAMFADCKKLKEVRVGNFSTASIRDDGSSMLFCGCNSLQNVEELKAKIQIPEGTDPGNTAFAVEIVGGSK